MYPAVKIIKNLAALCFALAFILPNLSQAGELPKPSTYLPKPLKVKNCKEAFDDPKTYIEVYPYKDYLPRELYSLFVYDEAAIKKMKDLWAQIVGFRSPDLVGKIYPEIKPGKYTYKDVQNNPGFKALLPEFLETQIAPGEKPYAGNFPEFEIVPTEQRYWALPIAEATKKNLEMNKLDADGYLDLNKYTPGIQFPRPSGEHKGRQLLYNHIFSYTDFGDEYQGYIRALGINKNHKVDFDGFAELRGIRLNGRVFAEPYGAFDEVAQSKYQLLINTNFSHTPRDSTGLVYFWMTGMGGESYDQSMIYVPSLRRIRKFSSTDGQDPIAGQDIIFDEKRGWFMTIRPDVFPWKFEVIEEREYLMPIGNMKQYRSEKEGMIWKNVTLERRPVYVVKATQLDPNYIYSYRVMYIDKETFHASYCLSFDKKRNLYRSQVYYDLFLPEMGMLVEKDQTYRDHIDNHTCISEYLIYPAFYGREDLGMKSMTRYGK